MGDESGSQFDASTMDKTVEAFISSKNLESLTRPFLDVLHSLTGLESTYLTEVNFPESKQNILFADNRGLLNIPEGLQVEWEDTLCRRALLTGVNNSSDVQNDLPGSQAARELGLNTFVSVPVMDRNEHVLGTLCGGSAASIKVSEQSVDMMKLFARLIADQWDRDQLRAEAEQRAQNAEERLRSRALFFAEAEHKLKSPLTLISGWSEVLDGGWNDFSEEQLSDAIKTIRKSAKEANQQIEDLLSEARSEVLSNQLTFTDVELCPFISEVTTQLDGSSETHKVTSVCPQDVGFVHVDRDAMWQVMWHLGENALKYSPSGGNVSIAVLRKADGVEITVTDEGLGVDESIDLFSPFTRSQNVREIKGTGLGLHIVRNLLQSMNGTVSCKKGPERGSVFTVLLMS